MTLPAKPLEVIAFEDAPVKIVWITRGGQIVAEQRVDCPVRAYEPGTHPLDKKDV